MPHFATVYSTDTFIQDNPIKVQHKDEWITVNDIR